MDFLDKTCQKKYKTEKKTITIDFTCIQNSIVTYQISA